MPREIPWDCFPLQAPPEHLMRAIDRLPAEKKGRAIELLARMSRKNLEGASIALGIRDWTQAYPYLHQLNTALGNIGSREIHEETRALTETLAVNGTLSEENEARLERALNDIRLVVEWLEKAVVEVKHDGAT